MKINKYEVAITVCGQCFRTQVLASNGVNAASVATILVLGDHPDFRETMLRAGGLHYMVSVKRA